MVIVTQCTHPVPAPPADFTISNVIRGFKSAINDRADPQPSQLTDKEGQA